MKLLGRRGNDAGNDAGSNGDDPQTPPETDPGSAGTTAPKGRPTPKRTDKRRGPVAPAPQTAAEARKRRKELRSSMTKEERVRPGLLNAKRKRRVAIGSGTTVQDVNKLLKMHQEMAKAMKRIKKMGGIKGLMSMFGGGGSAPAQQNQ